MVDQDLQPSLISGWILQSDVKKYRRKRNRSAVQRGENNEMRRVANLLLTKSCSSLLLPRAVKTISPFSCVRAKSKMADTEAPVDAAPAAESGEQCVDPVTGEKISKNELKRRLKAAAKEKEKADKAAAKAAADAEKPKAAAGAGAAAPEEEVDPSK